MNGSTPDSKIRLSSPLVTVFRLGVPLTLAATFIGCVAAYFSENDTGMDSLALFLLAGFVFVLLGRRCIRLVAVHVTGDQLRFFTCFQVHVFPVSDLLEVSVMYRRGIPWAVFRVSKRGVPDVRDFHTILRPKLEYLWTKEISDLSVLDGVLIRYKGLAGQERSVTIGERSDGRAADTDGTVDT